MAQLVLFDNTEGPGPDEFVVVDEEDYSLDELKKEYMARVKQIIPLPGSDVSDFPTNRSLVSE